MAKVTKLKAGDKFVFNDCKKNFHIKAGDHADIHIGAIYTVQENCGTRYFEDGAGDSRYCTAFEEYKITKLI